MQKKLPYIQTFKKEVLDKGMNSLIHKKNANKLPYIHKVYELAYILF